MAQLSTYYVGYSEISDLADDLRAAEPGLTDQQVHDRMLGARLTAGPAAPHADRVVSAGRRCRSATIGDGGGSSSAGLLPVPGGDGLTPR